MDSETTLSSAERTHRMERLLEISRTLSASLDLEPFLQSLIAAASELTGCETASILEPEEDGEQLHFLALPWFHRDIIEIRQSSGADQCGRVGAREWTTGCHPGCNSRTSCTSKAPIRPRISSPIR